MLQQDSVKERMFRTGLTLSQLSEIAGVADSKLSPWLRCTKALSNEAYSAVNEALNDVASLIALVAPVPVDLRNVMVVRDLISKMKKGELDYFAHAKQLAGDPHKAQTAERTQAL
jgi:hypothetical protein